MYHELQKAHHHFLFPLPERERLSRVADGLEPPLPDDKFKMGKVLALQNYGLRLGGQHMLALAPWRGPDVRAAVGDILATLLAVANLQNIKLDEAGLPTFDPADFDSFCVIMGGYTKGAEDIDHADPTAFASMRAATVQLAGWVRSAAEQLQAPLPLLLEEAHARKTAAPSILGRLQTALARAMAWAARLLFHRPHLAGATK